MTSVSVQHGSQTEGLRPVNLRTDLGQLADLIELVFADNMDRSGRAAVREMRTLSRVGMGLSLLPGLSDLTYGINMGYVWIADGKLVGNTSIYPMKQHSADTWIIANVGVHPDFQRRGIATQLMRASLESIRARGGKHAVLQVNFDNDTARRLYERLGFTNERAWIMWRRGSSVRIPPPLDQQPVRVANRRHSEWRAEYELAQRVRPAEKGGIGWQRPLHVDLFRRPLLARMGDWLNMRTAEHLVIRSEDERRVLAALWIESGFMTSSTQLTLMVEPEYQGLYDAVLVNTAARRFGGGRSALMIEHPADETAVGDTLREYQFRPQGHFMHMRWDAK